MEQEILRMMLEAKEAPAECVRQQITIRRAQLELQHWRRTLKPYPMD